MKNELKFFIKYCKRNWPLVLIILILVFSQLVGCAGKQISSIPEVRVVCDDLETRPELLNHIINRCTEFCGRTNRKLAKVTICYDAFDDHSRVKYLCEEKK